MQRAGVDTRPYVIADREVRIGVFYKSGGP